MLTNERREMLAGYQARRQCEEMTMKERIREELDAIASEDEYTCYYSEFLKLLMPELITSLF